MVANLKECELLRDYLEAEVDVSYVEFATNLSHEKANKRLLILSQYMPIATHRITFKNDAG